MKTTSYPLEDERGIFALGIHLFHAAMTPPLERPAVKARPGVLARFGRWLANARQRDFESWLATSNNVFELESRLRDAERRPYY